MNDVFMQVLEREFNEAAVRLVDAWKYRATNKTTDAVVRRATRQRNKARAAYLRARDMKRGEQP